MRLGMALKTVLESLVDLLSLGVVFQVSWEFFAELLSRNNLLVVLAFLSPM
jgi:hypothetical protein